MRTMKFKIPTEPGARYTVAIVGKDGETKHQESHWGGYPLLATRDFLSKYQPDDRVHLDGRDQGRLIDVFEEERT